MMNTETQSSKRRLRNLTPNDHLTDAKFMTEDPRGGTPYVHDIKLPVDPAPRGLIPTDKNQLRIADLRLDYTPTIVSDEHA